ncbi:hypothetical protein V6N11_051619 [Hibiscus sabdariffa]|uniref:Uncharacterized protein n=1 Tax=Hibiscus sabdariffa TaxID=183260 RepID=A0ABR2U7S9_9ROSI
MEADPLLNPPSNTTAGIQPTISYKDSLMGNPSYDKMNEDEPFDDDDIEVLEGNVVRSLIDGLILIQFSERI